MYNCNVQLRNLYRPTITTTDTTTTTTATKITTTIDVVSVNAVINNITLPTINNIVFVLLI